METGQVKSIFIRKVPSRRQENITVKVDSTQKTELQYIINSLHSFESIGVPVDVDMYTSRGLLLFNANEIQRGLWRRKLPFLKKVFRC